MEDKDFEAIIDWVRDVKGITKITLDELVELIPEYEEWLLNPKA